MDIQKIFLIVALSVAGYMIMLKWNEDYNNDNDSQLSTTSTKDDTRLIHDNDTPYTTEFTQVNVKHDALIDTPELAQVSNSLNKLKISDTVSESNIIHVKTDVINAQLNIYGGDILSLKLLDYPFDRKNANIPFELLYSNNDGMFVAQSGLIIRDGTKNISEYKALQKNYVLEQGQNDLVVDLKYSDDSVDIIKRYIFQRGDYKVSIEYIIKNKTNKVWSTNIYGQLKRDSSEDPSNKNGSKTTISTYLGGALRTNDKMYQKIDFSDFDTKKYNGAIDGGYISILQHYFVSAWVLNQDEKNNYQTRTVNGFNIISVIGPSWDIAPGDTSTKIAKLYAGPKDQDVLKGMAKGLNLTIDYGILWWFANPLFLLLKFLHDVFGNWGWSIIGLTVLVKLLFFPLSASSYRSMARMRKLTPKLQSLKEKYGDDKQQMSKKMMELYKKEKVNPVGGCLPLVVQMPVFIALYWVLLESVEIRQAPFVFWIKDLAQMDPYFILPLIMGGSMFIQQTLSPAPPDPMQAKIMKFMPVIFTFFFLWFPSGLVLYWVVNNVLSILQQWYVTNKINTESEIKTISK